MFRKFHLITRIFIIVFIVMSCTIMLNTIGILYVVEKNQRESAIAFEHTNLQRSAYSMELIIQEAKDLAIQINTTVPIRKLLYYSDLTRAEIDDGIQNLRNFQSLTGQVHSLYVLNARFKAVFYTGNNLRVSPEWDPDDFFDSGFLRSALSSQEVNQVYPIHRELSEYDGLHNRFEKKEVYSFIFSFSHSGDYEDSSVIVINISVDWMHETLRKLDQSPDYPVYVFTNNGDPVFFDMKTSVFSGEYLAGLLSADEQFTSAQVRQDGEEYLIAGYESSDLENWIFMETIPTKLMFQKTRQLRRTYALISLVLLALSAALAYISTSSFRRPLEELIRTAEQHAQLNRNDRLTIQYSKIQSLFQFTTDYSEEEQRRILTQCHPSFRPDLPFSLAYLSLRDKTSRNYYEKIGDIVGSREKKYPFYVFPIKSGGLALLSQRQKSHYKETLENLLSPIKDALPVPYAVIYFNGEHELAAINEKLTIFLELHPYLVFFACNKLEEVSTALRRYRSRGSYPIELDKKIRDAVVCKNRELFERLWKEFLDIINCCSLLFFHRSLSRFFLGLYESLREFNPMLPRMLKVKDLETLLDTLEGLDNYDSAVKYCDTVFEDLFRVLDEHEDNAGRKVIDTALAFIDEQYTNPLLGSQLIADHVSLSGNYLMAMFRKETKVSLHTYINNYRLKKAADLLENSGEPVRDIITLTGFTNEQSFFRLFKKRYNQTPSMFRCRVQTDRNLSRS